MQWRSARLQSVAGLLLVAAFAAACSQDGLTGPRIAVLKIAAGNGQSGPIGSLLPLPLVVQITDQNNAPVAGAVVTFAVTAGNGSVTATVDTTDAAGNAETGFRLGSTVGVQTAVARFADQSPVVFTASATTAPASKLVANGGDSQRGEVGSQLAQDLAVKVTDAFDNPKAGVPVSFAVTSGGGALNATLVLSDAQGIARVRWTLGTIAGTQSVTASTGAVAPYVFTATATPDDPAAFVVVSGGAQTGAPGAALPDSIVVRLVDQYGNGVAGVTVEWSPVGSSGSLSPGTTVTNGTGRTAVRWTLGTSGGPMTILAKAGTVQSTIGGAAFIAFERLSAGGRNSCGIDGGGVLYCWGFNGDGQLGIGAGPVGSGPVYAVPQAVPPIGNQTFEFINGGLFHNCGITFSHIGYCWGDNNNGQIGDGTNSRSRPAPTLITTSIPFARISAGRTHTCGVSNGGRGYCWGTNERGQLGASVAFDSTTVPGTTRITFVDVNAPAEIGSPANGAGTYFLGPWDWVDIAAGGVHSCGIRQGGIGYCWGLGREGQLGDGSNAVNQYFPQVVAGGNVFTRITAGMRHSCAIRTDGAARCWGDNTDGQLGNGAVVASNVPVVVSGGLAFQTLSAGLAHTCGLTTAGVAYCWGRNSLGQLGDGSGTSSSTPVAVAGGMTFATISAGDYHSCGVTTGGVAWCWGDNEYGALGDGTQINRSSPVRVKLQQ